MRYSVATSFWLARSQFSFVKAGVHLIRFIHSSDLHLGKPFGRFPEDVRARLRQARAEALVRLAELARTNQASHILLAGDTFDQTTPALTVVRQALNAMRAADHVNWVIMPGNHDHAGASELWRLVLQDAPANVSVLLAPTPLDLVDGVALLPAPPGERHPGRDLTEWFDSAPTGAALRIGLAHGSVTSFDSSEEGGSSVIPPDRARRAGLSYLALGDWHGQMSVGPDTWYSGAPEADGFKHSRGPAALLVEIASPRAPAAVTPLPTGSITWHRAQLDLSDISDASAAHNSLLPPVADRALTMFDLGVSGRIPGLARVALEQVIQRAAPDFLWHNVDLSQLGLVHDSTDLDAIDRQGALRAAADALSREATDPALSTEERTIAEAALSYLFSYAQEA